MAGVAIRIDGRTEAIAALGAIAARARNSQGLWENIGEYMVSSTVENFVTERGPGGDPWPQSLRAKFEGGKTLTDSARLQKSITFNASPAGVAVGTNVLYAAIQQFGGTITAKTPEGLFIQFGAKGRTAKTRRGKTAGGKWRGEIRRPMSVTLPARPFLGVDAEDEAEILRIAEDWIAGPEATDAA